MGALALSTGRAPAFTARRASAGPLLLVLGVHLLAGWWWLNASLTVPALDSSGVALRELFVVVVPPPSPARPPPLPRAAPARPAPRPSIPVHPATPAAPSPAPAVEEVETQASPAPAEAAPTGSLAEQARRAAGAADHALRGGKLDKLVPADTPWNRFVQKVEGARVESGRTLTSESYTSPDGTVVYRFRHGGKVWCRTGGHVRPRLGGAEGGGAQQFDTAGGDGAAGMIRCPSQAIFKPD